MRGERRLPHRHKKRLARRLAAYSFAVSAGAVAADQASARVVPFRPAGGPIVVPFDDCCDILVDIDIDGDGNDDYSLSGYFGFSIDGMGINQVVAELSTYLAAIISAGETIDIPFSGGRRGSAGLDNFFGTRGFLGVDFDIPGGSSHFGYLDVEIDAGQTELTIHGGAYESEPDTGIVAGAIPEPSGLAMLATGAVALASWRRR